MPRLPYDQLTVAPSRVQTAPGTHFASELIQAQQGACCWMRLTRAVRANLHALPSPYDVIQPRGCLPRRHHRHHLRHHHPPPSTPLPTRPKEQRGSRSGSCGGGGSSSSRAAAAEAPAAAAAAASSRSSKVAAAAAAQRQQRQEQRRRQDWPDWQRQDGQDWPAGLATRRRRARRRARPRRRVSTACGNSCSSCAALDRNTARSLSNGRGKSRIRAGTQHACGAFSGWESVRFVLV